MSKKGTTNQVPKKEQEIVDEQKDPMLRALQKKVRNINKKLTEIAELSLRKDLKPQQEQKVSKKPQILQQKEKYTEMIEVYKEIAGDNEKLLRKAQITELEDLAGLIAIKQYGADLGFQLNQNIDNLVKILTTPTSLDLTLQARVLQISTALTAAANNLKLKKNAKQFIQKNPTTKRVNLQSLSNEPEPISPRSEKQREEEIKQLEQEEQSQKRQNNTNEPLTPQVVTQHNPAPEQTATSEVPNPAPEEKEQKEIPQPEANKESNSNPVQSVSKDEKDKKPYQRRQNRGPQGSRRGGREGRDGRNYEERKYNKKPNFKPKYEDQKDEKVRAASSSSSVSSGSEPKAREFKRQEVRELIEDGFIVVGKPKIKARDQKQFHDHEHGNKHHRHHTKKNY